MEEQTNNTKEFPFLQQVPRLFLVYWFTIWSLLFLRWTSNPPQGGALDNSSSRSVRPPVPPLKARVN